MHFLADFRERHNLSVRDLSKICGGAGDRNHAPRLSPATVHRLLHRQLPADYVTRVEPIIVDSLRSYLRGKGLTDEQVPDRDLLRPQPQFTKEITVPSDCSANYVFKDQNGKVLSVLVFNQRA